MREEVRAMTVVTYDDFVDIDEIDSSLKGICVSIWRRMAADLGLVESLDTTSKWPNLIPKLESNEMDIIVERISEPYMVLGNFTR